MDDSKIKNLRKKCKKYGIKITDTNDYQLLKKEVGKAIIKKINQKDIKHKKLDNIHYGGGDLTIQNKVIELLGDKFEYIKKYMQNDDGFTVNDWKGNYEGATKIDETNLDPLKKHIEDILENREYISATLTMLDPKIGDGSDAGIDTTNQQQYLSKETLKGLLIEGKRTWELDNYGLKTKFKTTTFEF